MAGIQTRLSAQDTAPRHTELTVDDARPVGSPVSHGRVEHHQCDEHLYIHEGTFIDHNRESGPGTYIYNKVGSEHQGYTVNGCIFIEIVPGR